MQTNLNRDIKNKEEAKQFLQQLHKNREDYHPEDDANETYFKCIPKPSKIQRDKLNLLMKQCYEYCDPCEILLECYNQKK